MKDDKFNFYEWTGTPDMDLDGDIDSSDDLYYASYLKSLEKPIYENTDDLDENGEDIDDLDEFKDGDVDGGDVEDDEDDEDEDEDDEDDGRSVITEITATLTFGGGDDDNDDNDDDLTEIEKRQKLAREMSEYLGRQKNKSKDDLEYIKRCDFIAEGQSVAAKYCVWNDGFKFVEAVKDNFALPKEFVDYYDLEHMILRTFIEQLADYDIDLSIKVWVWLIIKFQPYAEYDEKGFEEIIYSSLEGVDSDMPDGYAKKVLDFLGNEYGFLLEIIRGMSRVFDESLIYEAIKHQRGQLAYDLFAAMLANPRVKLSKKEEITTALLHKCISYDRRGTGEAMYFQKNLMPQLKNLNSNILNKAIARWQKEIDEFFEDN